MSAVEATPKPIIFFESFGATIPASKPVIAAAVMFGWTRENENRWVCKDKLEKEEAMAILSIGCLQMIKLSDNFISDWKTLYKVLSYCNQKQIPFDYFDIGLKEFKIKGSIIDGIISPQFSSKEYIFHCIKEYPNIASLSDLLNFGVSFKTFKQTLETPEIYSNPSIFLEYLYELMSFDFASLELPAQRLQLLKSDRIEVLRELKFINPYSSRFDNYFIRIAPSSTTEVWPKIKGELPPIGKPAIVSEDEFWKRYDEFSYGVLDKLNLKNVFVAGGFVHMCLSGRKNSISSDLDVFVPLNDKGEYYVELLKAMSKEYKCYFASMGSVMSVFPQGVTRNFQFISYQKLDNIYGLISKFDTSYIQCGVTYDAEGKRSLTITPACAISLRDGVCRMVWSKNLRIPRLFKPLTRGYALEKSHKISMYVNFDLIYNNKEMVDKFLMDDMLYYHPDPSKDELFNIAMLSKITNYPHVGMDLKKLLNGFKYGGNFRDGYAPMKMNDFTISEIDLDFKLNNQTIRKGRKTVRFLTSDVIIHNLLVDNNGDINLTFDITEDKGLISALGKLENEIMARFVARKLSSKVVTEKDNKHFIGMEISKLFIELCNSRGYSPLKSKNGSLIDISEGLKIGDSVSIIFVVHIKRDYRDNSCNLKLALKSMIKSDPDDEIKLDELLKDTNLTDQPETKKIEYDDELTY